MTYAYQHLITPQNTGSGIAEIVYLAPAIWFVPVTGIKQPAAPFDTPGKQVIIYDTHEFKNPALGFFKMSLAPEKNSYDAKVTGDTGFHNLDHELRVFIPGSYAHEHAQARHLKNVPLIALHQDANCGANLWYQLGTDWLECYMTIDFRTDVTKGGVKGYIGTVSFVSNSVQIYKGGIHTINPPYGGDFNTDFSGDFFIE